MNKQPRGAPGFAAPNSNIPTRAPVQTDSEEQIDWPSSRHGCNPFHAKTPTWNTEHLSPPLIIFTIIGTSIRRPDSFLYVPEGPMSLLGWDLLCKLNAQVTFSPGHLDVWVPPEHIFKPTDGCHRKPREGDGTSSPLRSMKRPKVWGGDTPGKAKNTRPIQIPLRKDAGTPNLK